MSATTHIVGFIPPDEKYKKMRAVWDSCASAGIDVPDDVHEFFGWCEPADYGTLVDLPEECVSEYAGEDSEGHDIILSKLPKGVAVVRIYDSY